MQALNPSHRACMDIQAYPRRAFSIILCHTLSAHVPGGLCPENPAKPNFQFARFTFSSEKNKGPKMCTKIQNTPKQDWTLVPVRWGEWAARNLPHRRCPHQCTYTIGTWYIANHHGLADTRMHFESARPKVSRKCKICWSGRVKTWKNASGTFAKISLRCYEEIMHFERWPVSYRFSECNILRSEGDFEYVKLELLVH